MRPDRSKNFPVVAPIREDGGGSLPASAFPGAGKPIKRPSFTAAQRLATFEAFGAMVCCQGDGCDAVVRIKGCDIDHHLAVIDGGTHELSNWRPLCDPCHAKKSAGEHIGNCKAKRNAAEDRLHRAVMAGEAQRVASRMKSRGFQKHPTLKVQFGTGKVVPRDV